MDHQDRQAIEGLFGKLAEVERRSAPRDSEADAFISSRIAAQPGAPYFMAQTIVVQEQALDAAQARITDLEQQLASRPAGEAASCQDSSVVVPSLSTGLPSLGRITCKA